MSDGLKACPCGKKDCTSYLHTWADNLGLHINARIMSDCGWCGPSTNGDNCEQEAIKTWNLRASDWASAEAKSELIKIAAGLLTSGLSVFREDYPQRFPVWMLRKISAENEKHRKMAIKLRQIADAMGVEK